MKVEAAKTEVSLALASNPVCVLRKGHAFQISFPAVKEAAPVYAFSHVHLPSGDDRRDTRGVPTGGLPRFAPLLLRGRHGQRRPYVPGLELYYYTNLLLCYGCIRSLLLYYTTTILLYYSFTDVPCIYYYTIPMYCYTILSPLSYPDAPSPHSTQYSMPWFVNLFVKAIEDSEKPPVLLERLKVLSLHPQPRPHPRSRPHPQPHPHPRPRTPSPTHTSSTSAFDFSVLSELFTYLFYLIFSLPRYYTTTL